MLIEKALNEFAGTDIPDTKLYFWVSDRIPWELGEHMEEVPFFVFAKPKDVNNIIFPDNTFECITLNQKYSGTCYDWEQMKALFEKHNCPNKRDIIYFKGTPTTKKIHKIRETLEQYSRRRRDMVVSLDGWKNYTPMMDISKYRFLLNLPGHYPWSNRFKYLFLTGSVIINISVITESINGDDGWNEDEYHSFIDLIMEPGVDYVDLKFKYYNAGIVESPALQQKAARMTEEEIKRIIREIDAVCTEFKTNRKKYDDMVASYRRKIDSINNRDIYEYVVHCIRANARLIRG